MAVEIEKKFLLNHFPESLLKNPVYISQGYIPHSREGVIRIRIFGDQGFITFKSRTVNAARLEFEYPVPADDAKQMMDLFCLKPVIEKNRFHYDFKGFTWEIDCFTGDNQGLIVAEIELSHVDQPFEKPDWIGKEVTGDPRFFNSNLVNHPYNTWNLKKE